MLSVPRRFGQGAFTLVEMLAVMAIITIITVLIVPALKSLGGASGLNGAGNEVDGLLTSARQNSIAKGVLTAVVLLANSGTGNSNVAYRTMTLLQLAPLASGAAPATINWTQVDRWHVLPAGVIVDDGTDVGVARSSFLQANTISPMPPTLTYQGVTFQPASGSGTTGYYCQVFMPNGCLYQPPSPCSLQLTNGYYSGTTPVYTNAHTNYYKFICTDATGELKIIRP